MTMTEEVQVGGGSPLASARRVDPIENAINSCAALDDNDKARVIAAYRANRVEVDPFYERWREDDIIASDFAVNAETIKGYDQRTGTELTFFISHLPETLLRRDADTGELVHSLHRPILPPIPTLHCYLNPEGPEFAEYDIVHISRARCNSRSIPSEADRILHMRAYHDTAWRMLSVKHPKLAISSDPTAAAMAFAMLQMNQGQQPPAMVPSVFSPDAVTGGPSSITTVFPDADTDPPTEDILIAAPAPLYVSDKDKAAAEAASPE